MAISNTELARAVYGKRDLRAAQDAMVAVEPDGDGFWTVYNSEGVARTVDPDAAVCDCEDMQYNDPPEGCAHVRRVEMIRGARRVPDVRLDVVLRKKLDEEAG
ncbi:hypothetical protein J2752_000482 [Halarchaeum rubridurum]|uniref:SWIM-type domain-containing protein n=1 Tax=Halarchaeum rubridurum TaxID=489911 RepID=A0A830FYU8_9EURY|nr:hypothetical protein [Halarchaeum rubridurum]MBP1953601.1 hypothetical protein [Halarchaeum rubridurum]GGM64036.1 hypothetical protein GCM10009017_12620 [Halarchaeum rubridurum]